MNIIVIEYILLNNTTGDGNDTISTLVQIYCDICAGDAS